MTALLLGLDAFRVVLLVEADEGAELRVANREAEDEVPRAGVDLEDEEEAEVAL